MFIGDEREIVHLNADWSIVLSALLWVWFSLTVTVFAVREQWRRERQRSEGNLEQAQERGAGEEGLGRRKNQKDSRNGKQHEEA